MSQSCSTDQLNALLDFLNEHKDLARGLLRTADGIARAKRLWEEITQLLNSLGGSVKTVQQWQKVWTDRKHMAKKNAAAVRRMHAGTGGGPSSASLAQWELRVLDIMGEGFGGPQTTAHVPAFPTINIDEEVAQYEVQSEVLPQPEFPFPNESLGLVGTSDNLGGNSSATTEEISTEDTQRDNPPTLPEPLSLSTSQQLNRHSTPASSHINIRPSRRLTSRRLESNISDHLIRIENEKICILNSINSRLSGIEKAILELVKLKQNNTNSNS